MEQTIPTDTRLWEIISAISEKEMPRECNWIAAQGRNADIVYLESLRAQLDMYKKEYNALSIPEIILQIEDLTEQIAQATGTGFTANYYKYSLHKKRTRLHEFMKLKELKINL
jgi:hypothetical protein